MTERRTLPVPDGLDGERVDAAVAKLLGFSRTFASEVVAAGGVELDGAVVAKSDRVRAGAWLTVEWTPKTEPRIVPVRVPDFRIVFDDDHIVVIDKPVGVAAHPSVGWEGPTVLGALADAGFRISTSGAAERAGIVHRLDVGTSGLMVVAKSERAYAGLKRAFHDREVSKIYHAVVQGHPDPFSGTIDAPIGRHPRRRTSMAVVVGGKDARTSYKVRDRFQAHSLLELYLETGRTHQIRVHMVHIGHPLVGDTTYGHSSPLVDRHFLHAFHLAFKHPITGEPLEFRIGLPLDLAPALDVLRDS